MRWTVSALLTPSLALASAASALVPATPESHAPVAAALHAPVAVAPQDDVPFISDGRFENEVRPLLVAHCAECHGEFFPEADLDLETSAGLAAARAIAGLLDGEDGSLARAVVYTDPHLRMPPDGKLEDDAIATLLEWARAGAPLPQGAAASAPVEAFDVAARRDAHWAWQPVGDPAAPRIDPAHEARVRDELDRFLFAAIEEAGLEPTGPASKGEWLRRATFAVTGLPPTVEELVAFEADDAPDARERALDRLLGSPRFGERWARHWLDLVRYAETKAHEFDFPIPNAHAYRDYVIRAFDADVPYDRLVLEHLAGDLLATSEEGPRPDPTGTFDESVLATGWWFLHEDVHSPVDSRADECDRIANQVDTLSKAMLGMTVACARCHDHKFDAISAEDYHALAGFALSTGYRQVRYETDAIERDVAARLAELDERFAPRFRAATSEFLEARGDELRHWLDVVEGIEDAAAQLDERVQPDLDALEVRWMDLLLEDFEGVEWGGGAGELRPWTADGAAFLEGSMTKDDCQPWHGVEKFRGSGFVNSYAGHGDDRGDTHIGRLTSAPFVLVRDYLHFLVSGGDHETTQVRLEVLSGSGWRTALSTAGTRSNTYRPQRFDVASLAGVRARLVLVDEETGGWGHIGFDHVVASDDPSPRALERARPRATWNRLLAAVEMHVVERDPFGTDALLRFALALEEARTRHLASAPTPELRGRVVVDYADDDAVLLQNGHAFVQRSASDHFVDAAGTLRLTTVSAATARHEFGALAGSGERHAGSFTYEQAGRTLVTPTFELDEPRVRSLVRGRGRAYAAIDSHRMISGPLYGESLVEFDTEGRWEWVEHRLDKYVGAQVRVEFTALGEALELEVARVECVEAGAPVGSDGSRGPTESVEIDALLQLATELERSGGTRTVVKAYLTQRAAILADLPTTSKLAPAALELDGRDERVLRRGDPHSPGAPAPRRDLEAVRSTDEPLVADGTGSGRLALARAWTDPSHPLVARVWVNRVWHHVFGRGIVPTVDDLGVMGAAPSHPELLDALARDLVEDGWSTKRLLRRLLLSDAFARSSAATAEARALDPDNVLLARMPVRRLEAEAVRDALLFVSGSLDEARFGPSVPVHLTPFMNGRGRPGESGPLDGANRRSIYLAVRRNFLVPFLSVFDFPNPAACAGKRTVSNVPAQALALMNDPFVALCAQRAGERAMREPGDDRGKIWRLWMRTLGREPSTGEVEAALAFVEGDAEAWSDLAHTLFGLEDFLWLR